jgi:hypothetical protein
MPTGRRQWLTATVKWLFTIAVVFFVGRYFLRNLSSAEAEQLWQRPIGIGWLALSGALYILGLSMSFAFWYRLLGRLGQSPRPLVAMRAYFLGHLGKYLPFKAWALMLRAVLIRSPQVRLGVAIFSSLYEVLTTMAAGVLLGGLLAAAVCPDTGADLRSGVLWHLVFEQQQGPEVIDRRVLLILAVVLLAVVGALVLPPVYNRVAYAISRVLREHREMKEPPITWGALCDGLVLTGCGWLFLGASQWAVLQSILPASEPLTWQSWLRYTSYVGLAYVAGFVVIPLPNGLGVREFFLYAFLSEELARYHGMDIAMARVESTAAVLLLRVSWFVAEMVIDAIVYWFPATRTAPAHDSTLTGGEA